MTVADDVELTIDQLAQRTGMTVRNIRAHQSRGLLPPPEVRGRTGYYGRDHVARIELIKEMQAEGFNLDLIKRMLEMAGGSSHEVLRFTRSIREPFADEEPEIIDLEELAARFNSTDVTLIERSHELGLLNHLGDDKFEWVSPRLGRAGEELARLGVPAKEMLEIVARLRRHADSVANMFVEIFLKAVWRPFEEEGRPEERWHDVSNEVEKLRPLAADALLAVFALAMNEAVERGIGRELERDVKKGRKR